VIFRSDPSDHPLPLRAASPAFDTAAAEVHHADFRTGTGDELMDSRSYIFIFSPDGANRDPFRPFRTWEEYDFPPGHSRFSFLPSENYGDLSFVLDENKDLKERKVEPTVEERMAWRDAMLQSFGDLVEIPPVDRRND